MMVFLPLDTWMRLVIWLIIGLDVYLFYSIKHSKLTSDQPGVRFMADKTVGILGIVSSLALFAIAFGHHQTADRDPVTGQISDEGLFYFSLIFAAIHMLIFVVKTIQGYNRKQ